MAEHSTERSGLAPILLWAGGLCGLVAAIALSAASCGPSPLSKAYEEYDAKLEKLLDTDVALLKKLDPLFNEQARGQGESAKLEECVNKQAIPYYDGLVKDLAAIEPAEKELLPAHELVVKYAKTRSAFARHVAENMDVFRPDQATAAMSEKQGAAQSAQVEYDQWVHDDQTRVADARFTELHNAYNDFSDRMEGFAKNRISREDFETFVRQDVLPRVRKLRAGKFDEDAPSKMLREAIATAEEFYAAFADQLPSLDRNRRFGTEADRLVREGNDLRKKFRDELQAVRRRM